MTFCPPLVSGRLRDHPAFQDGWAAFQQGYFWEAHEAWEQVWNAAGRRGTEADLLKGVIKLAAAGVKLYEANPEGVRRHTARALELLHYSVAGQPPPLEPRILSGLIELATRMLSSPPSPPDVPAGQAVPMFLLPPLNT